MTTWFGQLVISRGTKAPFKVQYWRTPSMTPATIAFDSAEDLRQYLRHCRLSGTTPEQVLAQLQETSQVAVNTLESEEKVG